MTVSSTTNAADVAGTASSGTNASDAMSKLNMDEFVQLMITELQNQDPLNPMDSAQMLEQVGQIREIVSNDTLTSSLESLMLSQGVSMASSMIGQTVSGLTDESKRIEGVVDRVAIEDGEAKLIVIETVPESTDPQTGETVAAYTVEHTVSLKNVSQIGNSEAPAAESVLDATEQLAAANALLGQYILGTSQAGKVVSGKVELVNIEEDTAILTLLQNIAAEYDPDTLEEISPAQILEHRVPLNMVSSVLSDAVETTVIENE